MIKKTREELRAIVVRSYSEKRALRKLRSAVKLLERGNCLRKSSVPGDLESALMKCSLAIDFVEDAVDEVDLQDAHNLVDELLAEHNRRILFNIQLTDVLCGALNYIHGSIGGWRLDHDELEGLSCANVRESRKRVSRR